MDSVEINVESVGCDLCNSKDTEFLFEGRDRRYLLPGEFPVVQCRVCQLVCLNPRPTRVSIGRYYPDECTAFRRSGEYENRASSWLRSAAFGERQSSFAAAAWLYNSLAYRAFVPAMDGGRVLDVGCGTGAYLEQWKRMGWIVQGIEPSESAACFARQRLEADVQCYTAEEADLPAGAFDVVVMCHTLEHLHSPMRALEKIRRALKPAGQLLIMVPNSAGLDRRLFRNHWYGLEIPRHLYHFELRSLRLILFGAGFCSVAVRSSSEATLRLRSVLVFSGRDAPTEPSAWLKTLVSVVLLPLAAARATSHRWAVASPTNHVRLT